MADPHASFLQVSHTKCHRHTSNGSAVKSMKKLISARLDWNQLSRALLQYRNTPCRKDGLSPAPSARHSTCPRVATMDAEQQAQETQDSSTLSYNQHANYQTWKSVTTSLYNTLPARYHHRTWIKPEVKTKSGRAKQALHSEATSPIHCSPGNNISNAATTNHNPSFNTGQTTTTIPDPTWLPWRCKNMGNPMNDELWTYASEHDYMIYWG